MPLSITLATAVLTADLTLLSNLNCLPKKYEELEFY